MFVLELTKVAAGIIFLICLGFIIYWAIVRWQGDCHFQIMKKRRTPFAVRSMSLNHVEVSCTVPVRNTGKQAGTLMDVFLRTYLPSEQYQGSVVRGCLTDADKPRDDGYWESCIVNQGAEKTLLLMIRFEGKSGNILRDMESFPDMPIDIIYQVVGRSDWYYAKSRIELTAEELRQALYRHTSEAR